MPNIALPKISDSSKGIFFILSTQLCFAISNAFVKAMGVSMSAMDVLFYRHVIFLIPFIGYLLVTRGIDGTKRAFYTKRQGLQAFRGIVGCVGLWLIFYSFKRLPLAEASAFTFSGTLFVTMLAVPILKETIGWRRWIAVIVGFLGILLIASPSTDAVVSLSLIAVGAGILGAFLDAISLVYSRDLGKTDNSLTIFLYYSVWGIVASFCLTGFTPQALTMETFWIVVGVTAFSAVGQYFVTLAFVYAEASLIAPLIYTLLAWSALIGYLYWGEVPDMDTLIGASIVIAAGIFVTRTAKD